jgi:hypothetical protein
VTIIAELLGKLGFQVDKGPVEEFDAELEKSEGLFHKVKSGADGFLKKLGELNQAWEFTAKAAGVVYGTLKDLTLSVAEHGAAISDASQQLGIEADALQRLQYAAEMTGSSAETVNKAILEQSKLMRETAANAATPFGKALEEIGLTLGTLEQMDPADRFGRIGEALKYVEDAGRRSALSLALFGGEGAKILPLALEGRVGIRELGDEAERLGYVLGNDVVEGGAALDDSLQKTGILIQGIKNDVSAGLMPTISELVGEMSEWVKENRELIRDNVKGFIEGLINAGKALAPIVKFAAEMVGVLVKALGGAEGATGPVIAGLGAMRIALMALTGPWGLVAGAAVAAGVAIVGAMSSAEDSIEKTERAAKRLQQTLDFEENLKGKSVAELKRMQQELEERKRKNATIQEDVRGKSPKRIKELEEERKKDSEEIEKQEQIIGKALGKQIKVEVDQQAAEREREQAEAKAEDAKSQKISDMEELRFLRRKRKKTTANRARIEELEAALGPDGAEPKGGGGGGKAKPAKSSQKTADELIADQARSGGGLGVGGMAPGAGTTVINIPVSYHVEMDFHYTIPPYAANSPDAAGRYMGRTAAADLDTQNQRLQAYLFAGRTGKQ